MACYDVFITDEHKRESILLPNFMWNLLDEALKAEIMEYDVDVDELEFVPEEMMEDALSKVDEIKSELSFLASDDPEDRDEICEAAEELGEAEAKLTAIKALDEALYASARDADVRLTREDVDDITLDAEDLREIDELLQEIDREKLSAITECLGSSAPSVDCLVELFSTAFSEEETRSRSEADFRLLREKAGASQSQLADALGVKVRSVKRWESADSDMCPPDAAWELLERWVALRAEIAEKYFDRADDASMDANPPYNAESLAVFLYGARLPYYRNQEECDEMTGPGTIPFWLHNAAVLDASRALDREGIAHYVACCPAIVFSDDGALDEVGK